MTKAPVLIEMAIAAVATSNHEATRLVRMATAAARHHLGPMPNRAAIAAPIPVTTLARPAKVIVRVATVAQVTPIAASAPAAHADRAVDRAEAIEVDLDVGLYVRGKLTKSQRLDDTSTVSRRHSNFLGSREIIHGRKAP